MKINFDSSAFLLHQTNSLSIYRLRSDTRPLFNDDEGDFSVEFLGALSACSHSSPASLLDSLSASKARAEGTRTALKEAEEEGEKVDRARKSVYEIEGKHESNSVCMNRERNIQNDGLLFSSRLLRSVLSLVEADRDDAADAEGGTRSLEEGRGEDQEDTGQD